MSVAINTAVFLDELNAGASQLSCLERLQDYDVSAVQVRDEFFQADTRADELDQIYALARENSWKLHYSVPEPLFQDGAVNPVLGSYLNLATTHGVDALKFSLGEPSKQAVQDAEILIKPSGVSVSVENEGNDHGRPETVAKALQLVTQNGVIGFTFDAGNWYWVDKDANVNKIYLDLAEYVSILHLKNIDIDALETTLLADGDTDWEALVAHTKPGVPIFLEYNIPSDYLGAEISKINQFSQR